MKNYDTIIRDKRITHKGKCELCGIYIKGNKYNEQLAHRIHKRRSAKPHRHLYRIPDEIIDHPLNLAYTCSTCNQKVLIDNKPLRVAQLIGQIKEELSKKCLTKC